MCLFMLTQLSRPPGEHQVLNAFYTNEELKGKNLTGANGKSAIDPDILNSIIGKNKFKDVQVYNLVIAVTCV